jgi:hypothetical protein
MRLSPSQFLFALYLKRSIEAVTTKCDVTVVCIILTMVTKPVYIRLGRDVISVLFGFICVMCSSCS